MKVIYNKYLPPKNFVAINLFGIIFARKECESLSQYELNHERIHTYQIWELGLIPYYFIYVAEWLVRLYQYRDRIEAYRNISFEREAYENDHNLKYLQTRKLFSFVQYYKSKQIG